MNTPLSLIFIGVYRDIHIFLIILGHLLEPPQRYAVLCSIYVGAKMKNVKKIILKLKKKLCLLYGYVFVNSLG